MAYGNNPNFYNPFGYQQPYNPMTVAQQQYPQFNQPMQSQPQVLSGRMVDDISTVNANEVLMDGSVSIFPKKDMSMIYVKNWNADGTIKTVCYKPVVEEPIRTESKVSETDKLLQSIDERFDELLQKMQQVEKVVASKMENTSKAKKERDS